MDTSSMIEAKKEYTTQLQQILSPRIYERFKFIFDGTMDVIKQELSINQIQNQSVIKIFQKQLSSVKDWNESSIIEECNRIKSRSKCSYLDKLIKAVIIANMKILSTIQYNPRRKSKIQVHIPTSTHFIHKCYIECAKEIYKNPYIFDMSLNLSSKEKHQNLRDSLILIDNGIQSAIRQLLPIGDLLEQNFNSDAEDEDESSDDESTKMSGGSSTSTASEDESVSEDESDASSIKSEESEVEEKAEVAEVEEKEEVAEDGMRSRTESNVSSLSSASESESDSSVSLGTKVENALNGQSIDDIEIRIGGDDATQQMLGKVVSERAGEHVQEVSPIVESPAPQHVEHVEHVEPVERVQRVEEQNGGGGGFLGALYTTFANTRNLKSADVADVPAPTISPKPVEHVQPVQPVEEVKHIVYSGGAVPKGYLTSPRTSCSPFGEPRRTPLKPVQQVEHVQPAQPVQPVEQVQRFPLSQSIYPPRPYQPLHPVIVKKHGGSVASSKKRPTLKEMKLKQYHQAAIPEKQYHQQKSGYESDGSDESFRF